MFPAGVSDRSHRKRVIKTAPPMCLSDRSEESLRWAIEIPRCEDSARDDNRSSLVHSSRSS